MEYERVFDKLVQLHRDTLDPVFSCHRDRTLHVLCARIYKENQYLRHVNHGSVKDITSKALVLAYIMGIKDLQKRKTNFLTQDYDNAFYRGVWNLLCEMCAPDGKHLAPMPVISDSQMDIMNLDIDVTAFNIQNIVDDYVAFNIIKGLPHTQRNKVSKLLNLPDRWLSVHYLMNKRDDRKLPLDKIIRFMLGAYRLAYEKYPEPRDGYWLEHAENAWKRIHLELMSDMIRADKVRKQFALEEFGAELRSKIPYRF